MFNFLSSAQIQALIRFATVVAAGAASAALLNLGPLTNVITDPALRAIAFVVLTGLLQGILKFFGGTTVASSVAPSRTKRAVQKLAS